jgi:hypothetical protein
MAGLDGANGLITGDRDAPIGMESFRRAEWLWDWMKDPANVDFRWRAGGLAEVLRRVRPGVFRWHPIAGAEGLIPRWRRLWFWLARREAIGPGG